MIKFKSCPKCARGDLVIARDVYGWYQQCLQCAHLIEMAATPAKNEPLARSASIALTAA